MFLKINHFSCCLFITIITAVVSCKQHEPKISSDYITDVYEYVYGPGQHASIAKESDKFKLIGNPVINTGFLYLGGFGGYVVA